MGSGESTPVPPRKPVPSGKTRICVAGFNASPHVGRARTLAALIASKYPDKYETWFHFCSHSDFYAFTAATFDAVPFPENIKGHSSAPFCWLETPPNTIQPLGGRAELAAWATATFAADEPIVAHAATWKISDTFHNGDCIICGPRGKPPMSTADVS